MSDVKPTPIPWEVKKYRPDDTSTIHGANGAVVCIVYDRDAPLISAAPEMLAMLKDLEWAGGKAKDYQCGAIWNTCPSCQAMSGYGHHESCRLAALLAKAEGKDA
jgi:hypothetical protein